ncbi:MAG TPA: Tad domain-containing protein, partial [Chloroflexota bacterium]
MERWTSPDRERGQVLIIVASVMMLVLLGVAALTVDVGNALLQKRRLQNVADAAALAAASEIGRGSDQAAAALVAQNLVLTNTGNSVNPPYPASGGVNLTNGIEIDGGEVRVALRKTDVRTFFAGALGYQNLTVTARAHAGNNASAILPIAVKRYSAGQTTSSLTTQPSTPSTTDQLSRGGSLVLPDWPSPPWPALLTQSVGSYAADESNKGAVIPILGQEAIPNTDHPDFHYFIAPDVRNITHPQVEYYNGTSGSMTAQQLKNLESGYFLPSNLGYSSAKLPVQGDQIAVLNGVVTGQAVSLMKQYFPVKTTVSAIVYDGTVQSAPDFRLKITPDSNYSSMGGTITYTVALEQKSNPGLVNLSGVQFTLLGLDPTNNASWDFGGQGSTASVPVNGGNTSITLKITPAVVGSPGAPWQGAETFVVKAYDPLTQITRTAMAGAISGTSNV